MSLLTPNFSYVSKNFYYKCFCMVEGLEFFKNWRKFFFLYREVGLSFGHKSSIVTFDSSVRQ